MVKVQEFLRNENDIPMAANRKSVANLELRVAPTFIDLFAGCGGLSLGLLSAGWQGVFAVEKNPDAFKTYSANLIDGPYRFTWPSWLPRQALTTADVLDHYELQLAQLRGKIDLLAGGPPCQGFSLAGRRVHTDPRNRLTEDYLAIVRIIKPKLLLIENVLGFTLPFKKHGEGEAQTQAHSQVLTKRLESQGYDVFSEILDLSLFGVPQKRKRFIMIGIRRDNVAKTQKLQSSPINLLKDYAPAFRQSKGLRRTGPISVKEAIGDLETRGKELRPNSDSGLKGFSEIAYLPSSKRSSRYLELIRKNATGSPDSLRLARHSQTTLIRFRKIQAICGPGLQLSDKDRKALAMKKQVLTVLTSNGPAATITTLPDDVLHYSEPRILTVRENARLQSFPDWFKFMGKYTSGGPARRHDCPRYSQVGNAVPPLFAEAVGTVLQQILGGQRGQDASL
jgi:DNA (cytosine-5)-methyltransferase 1